MVAKTGAHMFSGDRFWEAFGVLVGTLGTFAYIVTDKERRKRYDLVAVIGVLVGSSVGSWGGVVLLIDVFNVPSRVAAAFAGLAALLGGTLGVMLFRPSLKRLGVDLEPEKHDNES